MATVGVVDVVLRAQRATFGADLQKAAGDVKQYSGRAGASLQDVEKHFEGVGQKATASARAATTAAKATAQAAAQAERAVAGARPRGANGRFQSGGGSGGAGGGSGPGSSGGGSSAGSNAALLATLKGQAAAAAAAAGVFFSLQAGIDGTIGAAIRYESAFTGVRKTVSATEGELSSLSSEIRRMSRTDLPVAATELANIAASAGQLGIKTKNISDFTRTIAQLGSATNLTFDDGASSLARFANITKLPQDQFSNLGSSIVALGNNLATTEREIVSISLRLAGAGTTVGLTEAEVLGLGAALSSLGIEAEAGGTAISKVLVDIAGAVRGQTKELQVFAAVAGLSVGEFSELFQRDAVGALAAFTQGLAQMEASGQNSFAVLESLGFDDARVRDAFLRVANSGELLTRSLELSRTAFAENTALATEAAARAKTTESALTLLGNAYADIATTAGEAALPAVQEITGSLRKFLDTNDAVIKSKLGSFFGQVATAATAAATAVGAVAKVGATIPAGVYAAIGLSRTGIPARVASSIQGFAGNGAESGAKAMAGRLLLDQQAANFNALLGGGGGQVGAAASARAGVGAALTGLTPIALRVGTALTSLGGAAFAATVGMQAVGAIAEYITREQFTPPPSADEQERQVKQTLALMRQDFDASGNPLPRQSTGISVSAKELRFRRAAAAKGVPAEGLPKLGAGADAVAKAAGFSPGGDTKPPPDKDSLAAFLAALEGGGAKKGRQAKVKTEEDYLQAGIDRREEQFRAQDSRLAKQQEIAGREIESEFKVWELQRGRYRAEREHLAWKASRLAAMEGKAGELALVEAEIANIDAELATPFDLWGDQLRDATVAAEQLGSTLREDILSSVKQFTVGVAQGTAKLSQFPRILQQSTAGNVTSRIFDSAFGAGGLFGTGTGTGDFRAFGAGLRSAFGFDAFDGIVSADFVGPLGPGQVRAGTAAGTFGTIGAGLGVGTAIGGFGAAIGQAAGIPTTGLSLGASIGGTIGGLTPLGPLGAAIGAGVGAAAGYLIETMDAKPPAFTGDRKTLDDAFKGAGVFPTLILSKSAPNGFYNRNRAPGSPVMNDGFLPAASNLGNIQAESAALFNLFGEPFRKENTGTLRTRATMLGQNTEAALADLRRVARGSGISVEEGVFNVTTQFLRERQEGKGPLVTQDEYNERIKATVRLLSDDLPFGFEASAFALRALDQFGQQSIINLEKLSDILERTGKAATGLGFSVMQGLKASIASGNVSDVGAAFAEEFLGSFIDQIVTQAVESGPLSAAMTEIVGAQMDVIDMTLRGDRAGAATAQADLVNSIPDLLQQVTELAAPITETVSSLRSSIGGRSGSGIVRQPIIIQNVVDGRVVSESVHHAEVMGRTPGVIRPKRAA